MTERMELHCRGVSCVWSGTHPRCDTGIGSREKFGCEQQKIPTLRRSQGAAEAIGGVAQRTGSGLAKVSLGTSSGESN